MAIDLFYLHYVALAAETFIYGQSLYHVAVI
jgi:hypothetical protein